MDINSHMTVGDFLSARRKKTQVSIAKKHFEKLGFVTQQAAQASLSRYERNSARVPPEKAGVLADAYEMNAAEKDTFMRLIQKKQKPSPSVQTEIDFVAIILSYFSRLEDDDRKRVKDLMEAYEVVRSKHID